MTDEQTTPEEITTELSLPGLELPEYHGRRPAKMKTAVSGTGNKITTAHDLGATVIFVAEAKVRGVGHDEDGDDLVYVEKLTVRDLYEIQGAQGKRLLSAVRSAYRAATDGATPLPYDRGAEVKTDASGVVITPGDALSIEGDSIVRSLTDESLSPVVVVYSDGARELWPDDFEPNDPRPPVGSVVLDEQDAETVVMKILDAASGETVEEWTDEQENARLLALEHAAEEDETRHAAAAEDRAEREFALGQFEELRARNETEELEGEDAELFVELRERFEAEARADREVFEDLRRGHEAQDAELGDPTPAGPGPDPAEANEELDGDPAETFPGYAGDAPDDELVIDEAEVAAWEGSARAPEVVDPMPDDPGPDPATPPAEPSTDAYAFVDHTVDEIRGWLPDVTNRDEVLDYLAAEEAGRLRPGGKHLNPRSTVLNLLKRRAEELFVADAPAAPPLPPTADGFEPPENADEEG